MSDWTKIARLFKERDNQKNIGAVIGTVVDVNKDDKITDLKIGILDNQIFLTEFYSFQTSFEKGDKLLFIASENNQEFFCLGKINRVGGDKRVPKN